MHGLTIGPDGKLSGRVSCAELTEWLGEGWALWPHPILMDRLTAHIRASDLRANTTTFRKPI